MMALLIAVLAIAAWLALRPPGGRSGRIRNILDSSRSGHSGRGSGRVTGPGRGNGGDDRRDTPGVRKPAGAGWRTNWRTNRPGKAGQRSTSVPMTVVVQQLAALLKGGRTPLRLWDELWLVYAAKERVGGEGGPGLTPASLSLVSVARAAAMRGSPVADAIRAASAAAFSGRQNRERRIWGELASCFDIAAESGCPLADVLTRLAVQLEVEDDAEAARQTALAGPKATVTLLTWLPLLGLGLGVVLGVDPLSILLGTPFGVAALAAGVVLTVAGRIWSAKLVRSAIGTS